jgi:hypothetical protein
MEDERRTKKGVKGQRYVGGDDLPWNHVDFFPEIPVGIVSE